MRIETIKYFLQSANINFLYGSGLSRPYLSVLGSIEKWLTELNELRQKHGEKNEYVIVEASILKQYFETVMLPNVNPSGGDYEVTKAEYRHFLLTWNELINKRSNRLVGKQINLFTTNVDIMMERAAMGFGVELNDGFHGSIEQVYDTSNFQKTICKTSLHFQNISDIPVFNLMKMHGSINWREEDNDIKNDVGLPTVLAVKTALNAIPAEHFVLTTTIDSDTGAIVDKTLEEMIAEAKGMGIAKVDVFEPFLENYHKLVMINPTKRKFKESVIDHHFYELMRQYSNNLEKENTVLFVAGFSFADEHIADITKRAANTNPTLHVVIFAFNDGDGAAIKSNLKLQNACPNNNIIILTPSSIRTINAQSQERHFQDFANNVKHFDFKTVNELFQLVSNGIITYGK